MPQDNSYKQYLVHSGEFVAERARGLEHFLRVITAHSQIRFDENLKVFLTSTDFKSLDNPYSHKLKNLLKSLPNLGQVGLDKDAFDAYVLLLSSTRPQVTTAPEDHNIKLDINR